MIAVIDYDAGNIMSVLNALRAVGADAKLVSCPSGLIGADGCILPGVGSFGDAVRRLEKSGFDIAVKEFVATGRPILGICLGMQLFFESSEESPGTKGLGFFEGSVTRLNPAGQKVPHTGWSSLKNTGGRLLKEQDGGFFYFVHSYKVCAVERSIVSASCDYGGMFDAAVEKGNIFGCQFHPEKSGAEGLGTLKRFVDMVAKQPRKSSTVFPHV